MGHGEVCIEEEVARMHESGHSVGEIARATGLTVEVVEEIVALLN